jgi:hypothetical protein
VHQGNRGDAPQLEERERRHPAGTPHSRDGRFGLRQVDARARRAARKPLPARLRPAQPQTTAAHGLPLDRRLGKCRAGSGSRPDADRQDPAIMSGDLRGVLGRGAAPLRRAAGSPHARLHCEPLLVQYRRRALR